jgi:hypothetical protein
VILAAQVSAGPVASTARADSRARASARGASALLVFAADG